MGGGYTYFPTTGIPSLGITNPYGMSFWSPYQAAMYQAGMYSPYFAAYPYGLVYQGWPSGLRLAGRPVGIAPFNTFVARPVGAPAPRVPLAPMPHVPTVVAPRVVAPRVIAPHAIRR